MSVQWEPSVQWITLFDLKTYLTSVAQIQQAILATLEFGLKPEPALFGSAAWWQAIEDEDVPSPMCTGEHGRLARVLPGHGQRGAFIVDRED